MDFTQSKRLFHRLCAPLLRCITPATVAAHNADYRCHKFTASHHVLLSVFAQLSGAESANALIEELNDLSVTGQPPNLRELIGFTSVEFGQPVTLNQSSFSRANAHRSYRLWKHAFHQVWAEAKKHCQPHDLAGLGQVVAVDGTLFDCLPKMVWAAYSSTKTKLKGHFFFNLAGLPERMVLTTGKGSEREVLGTNYRAGVTYLIDRGYNDYTLFAQLSKAQAHFVTRLLKNASFRVLETYPVPTEQAKLGVLADQKGELATAKGPLVLRLVSYQALDGKEYRYLTSRFELDALTIARLYDHRWQIERFFAWIKQHLQLSHWYSENENGVLIQLYAALLSFLLLKLYSAQCDKVAHRAMHREFVRWIARHLFDVVEVSGLTAYHQLLDSSAGLNQSSP